MTKRMTGKKKKERCHEPGTINRIFRNSGKIKMQHQHNWTTNGRQESVAEHSWRLAVLAMLMEDDFPELDMNKVIRMCLIHDWGEAVTGDIPAFVKTEADEEKEADAIETLLKNLPETNSSGYFTMFKEMSDLTSDEAIL